MRPFSKTYTPAAVDTDGYVDGGSGASLTLLASSAGDSLAHQLNFTSAANISDHTFLVTGTDENGIAQTETVTGPNANTVESAKYFLAVSSIVPNATLGADTVDIGWVDEFVTPAYRTDRYRDSLQAEVIVTGTIDYSVQRTLSDMSGTLSWADTADATIDLIAITASVQWAMSPPPQAIRLKANSYSSSSVLVLRVIHND